MRTYLTIFIYEKECLSIRTGSRVGYLMRFAEFFFYANLFLSGVLSVRAAAFTMARGICNIDHNDRIPPG